MWWVLFAVSWIKLGFKFKASQFLLSSSLLLWCCCFLFLLLLLGCFFFWGGGKHDETRGFFHVIMYNRQYREYITYDSKNPHWRQHYWLCIPQTWIWDWEGTLVFLLCLFSCDGLLTISFAILISFYCYFQLSWLNRYMSVSLRSFIELYEIM